MRPPFLLPFVILLTAPLAARNPAPAAKAPPGPPPPSILLITLDTTRADHLGCYGSTRARTPNLDALAARGIRVERAWASAPVTLSSHATLMTGAFPVRHGARDNGLFRLEPGVETLAEVLKKRGYRTAAFISSAVLDRQFGLARGFDFYDDNVRVGEMRAFGYTERAANQVTAAALAHLPKLKAGGQPFFLWIHYYDAHFPWVAPNPFKTEFRDSPYDGELAFIDENLGELFAGLQQQGLDGNLLTVAVGDHGEMLGERGEPNHGVFIYPQVTRVPLLIAGPGLPAGAVVPEMRMVDIAPLLALRAGAPAPRQSQGVSRFLGCLSLEKSPCPPLPVYQESFMGYFSYGFAPLMGLIENGHQYIAAPQPELYDLIADPALQNNLLAPAGNDALREGWASKLAARLAEWSAPGAAKGLPAPNLSASPEILRSLAQLGYVGTSGGGTAELPDPKHVVDILGKLRDGEAHAGRGQYAKAAELYEAVLRRTPGNFNTYGLLGGARLSLGQPAEALRIYRAGLKLNPRLEFLRLGEARALAILNDPAADERYRSLIHDAPRMGDAYLAYYEYLAERKRPDEARRQLDRARAAGIDDAELRYRLGEDELRKRRKASAESQFRKAVEFNKYHAEALARLGELVSPRDRDAARDYYRRAIEEKPNRNDWKSALLKLNGVK